ncbi:MAG: hypothetical protein KA533_03415 [Sphingobium sp.]|nr:hypothetical protein [Sphingobium sp.]MBP6111531.1 hypothetical protein [Sphingobium sp.]MBP8670540.1 hypothetical protein [Sphingobium sp.]MBP9157263.1 hypothetical protein [Sphingobium sp.]MCC6482779.1 hypothetical protein [Sphingomonadaceae bacterium]
MSMRIIRLGPGECSDIETGARFFAALAFPTVVEDLQRQDAVAAWVGSYLHEANRIDDSDQPFADDRLNAYAALSPKWCRAKLRTAMRRIKDRSLLARAVRPWVWDHLGQQHRPLPDIEKFTQRQIALYLAAESGLPGDFDERARNFQKRVWRPGRPVIHLAITCDFWLGSTGYQEPCLGLDLTALRAIGGLVDRARHVANLIVLDRRFGVTADDLLHLEWVS